MASILKWLLLLVVVLAVGFFIYLGLSGGAVERTMVEQPVDRETLGI
ncbi:MAG: hypothetical protein V2J26_00645 [Pacificimonas sp.]|jgi:hypothetical protein|nr:hypothetical protein [Pacificimonas sp.]